jgi:hypothetical protein
VNGSREKRLEVDGKLTPENNFGKLASEGTKVALIVAIWMISKVVTKS